MGWRAITGERCRVIDQLVPEGGQEDSPQEGGQAVPRGGQAVPEGGQAVPKNYLSGGRRATRLRQQGSNGVHVHVVKSLQEPPTLFFSTCKIGEDMGELVILFPLHRSSKLKHASRRCGGAVSAFIRRRLRLKRLLPTNA